MMNRRGLLFALAACGSAASVHAVRPTRRAADVLERVDLEAQIPRSFGGWKVDPAMVPVLPDPSVQEKLDKIYTQLIARTYVDPNGRRVMFTIAYGADQATDATSVHRPEFCYSTQGFAVKGAGISQIQLDSKTLKVQRLIATMGARSEPITYWITLNNDSILPGLERKLTQIKLGILGTIPDGMLVRVSSVDPSIKDPFEFQEKFLKALEREIEPSMRSRYFGT